MAEIIKNYTQTNWRPSYYAIFYPQLREIAIEHGYTLAIHGSMGRDMDLIAVAWADEVKPHYDMILKMCELVGGIMTTDHLPQLNEKPHGRLSYTIPIIMDRFIDISVIPPR